MSEKTYSQIMEWFAQSLDVLANGDDPTVTVVVRIDDVAVKWTNDTFAAFPVG